MITRQIGTLVGVVLLTCCFVHATQAQETSSRKHLENIFAEAVLADGPAYIALRDEILTNRDAAVFLLTKTSDTNLLARVLARAMLTWTTDAAVNITVSESLMKSAERVQSSIAPAMKLDVVASSYKAPSDRLDASRVAVLLEIAFKGPTVGKAPYQQDSNALTARALAIGFVGLYSDPDVMPSLCNILATTNTPHSARLCATIGLRHTKSPTAIAPLIASLSDENKRVRESAQCGLKDLTGQNFAGDQVKYRDWWNQNKDQLLKTETAR